MAVIEEEPLSALAELIEKLDSAGKTDFTGDPDDEPLKEDPKVNEIPGSAKFEGSEHRAIGDAVKLYDINGKELDASTYIVQHIARNGTNLTLGRIISLAGDFYSNRNPTGLAGWEAEYAPICGAYYDPPPGTPQDRFNDMVSAMLLDDFNYMNDLKGALDLEKSEIDNSLQGSDGGGTARTFHDATNMHGDAWFSEKTTLAYPKIAWQNADHFGEDALFCYKVGHAMACNAAVRAGLAKEPDERTKLLNSAYFIEACSLHYFTDKFSSGHMRAPRRAFHYKDYKVMTIVGLRGIPVWDSQCRVMHDDDNSIGLLCKNGKGEQWIAFGDKQFFMPANCVNRARVVHAVQTSVAEVFSYFQQPLDGAQQSKKASPETRFQTLPLIPHVTLSLSNDPNWASSMTDNPAPIWVAKSQNDPSKDQGWYYRKQIDNHAAYTMAEGHPGFAGESGSSYATSDSVKAVMGSQFLKGDEQFPRTQHIECAVGLLQLSEIDNSWLKSTDYAQRVYANIWTPVLVKGTQYSDFPQTMTLRSRSCWEDLSIDDPRMTPLVHALGYFDGKSTTALVFRMQISNPTEDLRLVAMNATCFDIKNAKEGQPEQWHFTPGLEQSSITKTTRWSNKPVFSHEYSASTSLMDFRCFVVNPAIANSRMTLFSVVCDSSNVYYSRTYLDDASTMSDKQAVEDWTQKLSSNDIMWSARPFLKAWECANGKRAILFCQHSAITNGSFDWQVAALEITDANGQENYVWRQRLIDQRGVALRSPAADAYHNIKSSCFLVGEMIGSTNWPTTQDGVPCEQIAAVTISPTYTQLDVVGWCDNESPKVVCKHDCADNLEKGPAGAYKGEGYLRDYFIGLIDSQLDDTKSGKGLDILHVSLHRVGTTCYLKFKTHVNDRAKRNGAAVPGRDQDYFGSCNVNWIKDELMSQERYQSGRYQSLKWLRMDSCTKQNKNAIMEVFSWYGILGLRYFAAAWDGTKYDYSMVGVQPFNGQTSGTVGRGIYGTWGEGFLTMGQPNRAGGMSTNGNGFRDVNYYNMVLGGKVGHGYWDSANKDPTVWSDPGFKGDAIRRESDFVRGVGDDVTPLAF